MFIRLPVVALLVAGPCLVPIPAHAAAGYSASASSTGARLSLSNESVPLGLSPQLLAPTAEVTQTSLQQSDAYAALPSPGRDVGALPGTVLGGAGMTAPPYPFELTGAFGDRPKDLRYPGVALRTETREWLTRASAVGGSPGAGASSDAWVERIDGAVSVGADSAVDGIRLGESLIINGLRAAANAARDASGKLTRSSTLSFASISAPGLELGLPVSPPGHRAGREAGRALDRVHQRHVHPSRFRAQIRSSTPLPTNDVLAAFAAAGYKITYQAPQETADGIIGAGLQIATTLPGPPAGFARRILRRDPGDLLAGSGPRGDLLRQGRGVRARRRGHLLGRPGGAADRRGHRSPRPPHPRLPVPGRRRPPVPATDVAPPVRGPPRRPRRRLRGADRGQPTPIENASAGST